MRDAEGTRERLEVVAAGNRDGVLEDSGESLGEIRARRARASTRPTRGARREGRSLEPRDRRGERPRARSDARGGGTHPRDRRDRPPARSRRRGAGGRGFEVRSPRRKNCARVCGGSTDGRRETWIRAREIDTHLEEFVRRRFDVRDVEPREQVRDSGGENSPEIYHSPPREIAPGRATMRSQTLGDDRVRRDPSVRSPTFALASPRRPPLRRARLPRRSIDHLAPPTTSARAVLFAEGRAPMQFSHFFLTAPVRQEDPTQPDASARAGRSRDWLPAQ